MKYILVILIIVFAGCKKNENFDDSKLDYIKELSVFKNEFVDHFPQKLNDNNTPYGFCSTFPLKYECMSMELYETISTEKIERLTDSLIIISQAIYGSSDTCMLIMNRFHNTIRMFQGINLSTTERRLINRDCYKDKLPIQNFYASDLATDETRWKLPKDFVLYVLDAKKGKYWDDKYLYGGKYMPPEWEHGYSKGIAISKKRNIVLYWFVIW